MPPQLQSPEVLAFANGFPLTLLHAAVTLGMLVVGAGVYMLLTPHKEIPLIRDGNVAAGVSLGGVILGLAIPLAMSLSASTSIAENALWGAATVVVQLLVFRIIDVLLMGLPQRIQDGEVSAAALLVGAKLGAAVILAAALSS